MTENDRYDLSVFDRPAPEDMPERSFAGLRRHVVERIRVGHFLTAVLENDLQAAVAHADGRNFAALKCIVQFVYNELPADCWGSPAKVALWLFRAEGVTPDQDEAGAEVR